ncbi:MAG TPA: alpha/beta hydrolase [Solirubrobacteraceae bacterium]|nr:alpha/beta hydrolase [Solirubrobacteraceae bacterium]
MAPKLLNRLIAGRRQTLADPFVAQFQFPVPGGWLNVARSGPTVGRADGVVLAVHGITASHVAWRTVARVLAVEGDVTVLSPDLRGRGRSGGVPGPFGISAHVADLVALLDREGVESAVLAGHSMGGYVAARLAAEHPERVSSLVLIDGGLQIDVPADKDPAELLAAALGPAAERLDDWFASRADYVAMWRAHPAFADAWNADVEAYVNYDVESAEDRAHPNAVRSRVSSDAVWADGREILLDEVTRTALDRVSAPVRLLRAPRGILDDDRPLIPPKALADFASVRPGASRETVPGTNHYTILLGPGAGPARVAEAIHDASSGAGLAR